MAYLLDPSMISHPMMTLANDSLRAAALLGATIFISQFHSIASAQEPPQLAFFEGHQKPVYAVAFAPDGKTFVSADLGGVLRVWDRATGKPIRTWQGHAVETEKAVDQYNWGAEARMHR